MDQFVWKDQFRIGIDEIDRQHQALLRYLNDCMQKASLAKEDFDAPALLAELASYTDTHFRSEEELMQSVDYPGFESHRQQHRILLDQMDKLKKEAPLGKKHFIINLTALLKDWFMQHILEEDQQIEAYLLTRTPRPGH